jgi:benzoyl-CoA reductase/2-hydroxyglutaryl-CoA dehydratase subunit BcrC/BadD/HgdB
VTSKTTNRIESIIKACSVILRMIKARPNVRKSEQVYYEILTKYFTRIRDVKQNGDFLAAHTVFFPTEILYAMNIVPMHTESTTWMTALFTGEATELVTAGAEAGLASEICTPHRGIAGAFTIKALPDPDVMLWSNLICDNTAKSGELIMELCGCPGYFLDHPFQESEQERNYLIGELQGMIDFLQDQSGRKMDWDKLSQLVAEMDKQIKLNREICELRKAVPTPFSPQGFLELLTLDYLFPGQPEATLYLETLRDELKEKVNAKTGAVENERFRLMSLFVPPMYLMSFLEKMSHEFGAVSVIEPFFTYWADGKLDPSKPLESVAQKSYMIPEVQMYGPMTDAKIQRVSDLAKQYKIDGAVFYADTGCRQTCALIKLLKDTLSEIDIPMLTLDSDVVDPTMMSQEDIREKFEGFFELLEDY